jgi:hypothetical protein
VTPGEGIGIANRPGGRGENSHEHVDRRLSPEHPERRQPRSRAGGKVRWLSAFCGIVALALAVGFAFALFESGEISTTDADGNQTTENRPIRPHEKLQMAGVSLFAAALGGLLLSGAWTDERVPDKRWLAVLGVCLATVMFTASAAVTWIHAWRSRKMGDDHRGGPGTPPDPEDSPDDVVDGPVASLLLSPLATTLVGAVFAALAVYSASQLPAAWRGDWVNNGDDWVAALLQWLHPVHALGDLLGIPEVIVALILLGIWIITTAAAGYEAIAVLNLQVIGVYAVVALIVWPFGLLDGWLGFGRGILSLL